MQFVTNPPSSHKTSEQLSAHRVYHTVPDFANLVSACVSDRQALSDPQGVERIQDRLIEALRLQVSRNHSTEENLFATIIMKLPELRTLGSQHNEMLRWYRARWQRVELPPLFAEIYDIPKSMEDAQS